MRNFSFHKPATVPEAVALLSRSERAKLLGGGTNLVDLMRENIEQPAAVIDVTGLPLGAVTEGLHGEIVVGATTRNSALAGHRLIRERYPVLSQALLAGASGQIRNMATVAGNIMQRTRCSYFYDEAARCNKRSPGAGCDAMAGFNRMHAILGASPSCIATHPSDMCVAMAALDAVVHATGPDGARAIPLTDFHLLPGEHPELETRLRPDELITAVELPALSAARNSSYRKVRDRASFAFALVSVAAVLEVEGGVVKTVRLALGGVAPRPWRATAAEATAVGAAATPETFRRAAEAALADARGHAHNGFKIELARRLIVHVLTELAREEDAR
jgi:xanthine dehydrogenase YagS FAD-binding subunit